MKGKDSTFKSFLYKLGGYYLIPHELLHVLAYRIVGEPCHYKWGSYHVQSSTPKRRREKLFILLFPFVICWVLGFFFGALWILSVFFIKVPPERYFIEGPSWHIIFLIMAWLSILYSGTAHQDLIDAYGWLFKYKAQDDSPEQHQHTHEN